MIEWLRTLVSRGGIESQIHIWQLVVSSVGFLASFCLVRWTTRRLSGFDCPPFFYRHLCLLGLSMVLLMIVSNHDVVRVVLLLGMMSLTWARKPALSRGATSLHVYILAVAFCFGSGYLLTGVLAVLIINVVLLVSSLNDQSENDEVKDA